MSHLAPIVLFVYNRPQHTLQTLEALCKNNLAQKSNLYIFADGPKVDATPETISAIEQTRAICHQKKWCKNIHISESKTNNGLADSITRGVTDIVNKYGKIIVLEDDIVTSSGFLQYMNDALSLYETEDKVMHISGFVPFTQGSKKLPETYFLRFMSCWGWATWKEQWDQLITDTNYIYNEIPKRKDSDSFNLEGAIDIYSQVYANYIGAKKTWAFKWYSTVFINNGLCLYPRQTLVDNIGHDGSGENCSTESLKYQVVLTDKINVSRQKIKENKRAKKYLKQFYFFGNSPTIKNRIFFILRESPLHFLYKKITRSK